MKILIVGIGGIGGYLGTKLAQKYAHKNEHQIIFLQRGVHGECIKKFGLKYITKKETIVHPHFITDNPSTIGACDLIIFAVKSKDLETVAFDLQSCIDTHTVLLSTLNGVNNAQRLRAIYTHNAILNGCIYVSASIKESGVVKQKGGAGNMIFGPEDGAIEPYREIETLLKNAGIKAILTNDIITAVWKKFLFISSLASLTTLYDKPMGAIIENEKLKQELLTLLSEIRLLAATFGAKIPEAVIDDVLHRVSGLPYDTRSSMQIDYQAKKQPELDIFTGFVVNAAKEKNVHVPFHEMVYKKLVHKCKM